MSELSNDLSNKKRNLGRGLGSLLGGSADALSAPNIPTNPASAATAKAALPTSMTAPAAPQIAPEARIWQVAIDKLSQGQFQPRTHFEKEKLQELAQSIKENGILQPIVARKLSSGKFEIIAGERRWRAAQLAGLHEVPVILKNLEDQQTLELAIIENIQREDLNAIEEAEAYARLAGEFKLTQQQIAEKVGKERATVANSLRLLQLPQQVREMIVRNEISQGHAKVLLSLPDATQQLELARKVMTQKLSVRQLEKMAAKKPEADASVETQKTMDSNVTQRLISGLAEEVQKILGTKVSIDYLNSKGKISIHFYSDDELTEIVNRLKGS
jgi:ParB family chromosome partitioning protein